MQIYRKTQGRWTRLGTVTGVGILVVVGAWYAWQQLAGLSPVVQTAVPLGIMAVCFYILLRVVNSKRAADFMIATEGEMKKVSWSSKKEIIGSTKVVIVVLMIMGAVLALVDLGWHKLLQWVGVQQF
ncbi:MAG: preprotein translocase subunit SecE [Actinobacteria bacterium]|nr:preprotein translocase subunit SecE [Actinomycetota bacterium]